MTGRERLKDIANKWCHWIGPEDDRERYREIGNAALEALAHGEQLHALALQNVQMREALERLSTITEHDNVDSYMLDVLEAERVLALPLPDAAREVAEWRRDSERLTLDSASAQASDAIIARIKEERRLQDRKWGGSTYDDQHSLGDWAHLIEQRTSTLYRAPEHKVAKQELIEVAALAVAALESLWRNREGK